MHEMKLVIHLFLVACSAAATCGYFHLQEGFEYVYKEDVECHLGKSGTILVKAKVSFTPIKTTGRKLEISQAVYHVIFHDKGSGRQSQADSHMDFSKWFSIVISLDHGDIEKVYHPPDEDSTILGMKKSFATLLFGKLHSHDDPTLKDINHDHETGKWTYSTMENGHEGLHNASYTAEPTDRGIRFTKTRLKHPQLKTAINNYTKVLHYDSHLGLVSTVNVDEFIEVGKSPKGFDPFENDRPPLPNDTYIRAETPLMTATSVGSAQLLARNRLRGPSITKPKYGLVDGMIHVTLEKYKKTEKKVQDPNYAKYLRGNFTCLQKLTNYGSIGGFKCFKELVNVLKSLPDEDLISVTERVFKSSRPLLEKLVPGVNTSADSLHMVDALFDIGTDLSIGLLVEFAFNSNTEILKRTMFLFSDVDKPSIPVFDKALERYCFFPETFPESVHDDETHHRALLALGSIVHKHDLNGRKEEAHRLVSKLEAMLGLHDPHAYNTARSTLNKDDAGRYDLKHVVLLESLGNAVMDRSYDHIISYVNSSTHSVLKRAGLHALRKFQRLSAVSTLHHAATKDESMIIRHESAIILRRHKRKAMFPMVDLPGPKIGPMTLVAARHHREKRDLYKRFHFELRSPGIDWRKMLGSKTIGASFGLIIKNDMEVDVGILNGNALIDVHDEAQAKIHLGIVGYNYDFLVARICFNGRASYNLNILQEFNFLDLMKQIKKFFSLIGDTVNAITDGIKFIQDLVNGDIKIKDIIEAFVRALEDMPKKIADIGRKGFRAMKMIGMFDDKELPAFLRPAKNVIIRITNLYNSIKTSIMDFYNKMTNAVITFKRSYKMIFESVKAIINSIKNFRDSPKQALAAVFKGVTNIKLAVTDFLEAKNATMEACFFLKDEKPDWWDLNTHYTEIKEDVKAAFKAIDEGGKKWVTDIVSSDDPIAKLTNGKTTMQNVKEKFLADLQDVINVIVDPFKTLLGNLAQPFLEAYQRVMGIIQKLKDGYEMVKKGYNTARQIIAVLFGPKAHARFPRVTRLADSGKCSKSGFWPSNIGYRSGEGIDLTIREGAQVVAPFAGKISLTDNPDEVKILITDGSLSNTYVYITNVNPNDTIQQESDLSYSTREVFAGQVIGVATKAPCRSGQNHIHFVMKKTSGNIIDPTNFLAKRLIEIPKWKINCNDYKYVFKGEVISAGWDSPGSKDVDSMPQKPSEPGTSMKAKDENEPASESSGLWSKIKEAAKAKLGKRRKRGLYSGKDSLLSKLGFPKLGQKIMTTLKKFNMKKLKLGKIVRFLDALGMKESTKKLAQVIRRIKELIDSKPCFNPHQLTDDQLRNELADRRLVTSGSRQLMVERILHSEPKCALIQLKMPKQIHCVFDENCLAVQCCMNLKVMMFNKAVRAFVRLDPCDFKFEIGVDKWKYSVRAKDIYFNKEETVATGVKFDMFDMDLEIVIGYKLEKTENVALVSFKVGACSQNDHNSCFVDVPLLDEAVIPLPICRPDGSVQWPDVNWDEFFSLDAVKKRLKEGGKRAMKEVAKAVVGKVLKKLGIPESVLSSSGPCPRPEVMNIRKMKSTLKTRGLAMTGTRAELNARLARADKNCEVMEKKLTLPAITNPTLKKLLYYKISPTCTRIDACVDFSVKALGFTKSFKAFVDIDVCKYMIKIGFETIIHPIPIFVFDWGKLQQQKITENIILSYAIDRDDTKKVFKVSLSLKMCLAADDCPVDAPVLTNVEIPQPICNENFSLDGFKPGDGSLGKFLKELGGQMNNAAFNYILKLFKLDNILSDNACTNTQPAPTCPWRLNLKWLPQSVRNKLTCRLSDNCFGAGCCLHLPFKLPFVTETIHKYLDVAFEFDPCEFTIQTKFGPEVKKTKLGYYNWGEVSVVSVGHGDPAPVVMTYSVKKNGTNVILNMKISICLHIEGQSVCVPDENGIEVFKDKSVPLCHANAMAALAKTFKVATLKDYLKAQGMVLGKAIVGAGIDMFLEQTGIKEYLKEPGCDSSNDPYTPAVDGWKNDCKLSIFKLPRLPEYVKCHFDKNCRSVKCCLDVDFYGIYTHSFHFYMTLDTCDLIFKAGLEKITYSYTLLKYHWGKPEKFSILNMFDVKYSIQKSKERKVFILNAELCVSFEKNGICDHEIKFMDNTEIPQLQCDLVKGIANLPADINSLKKYMTKLGTQAAGLALMIPLRMLGLGSVIGLEGLCPDQKKPLKNPCPFMKNFKVTLPASSSSMNCAVQPECRGIECCISIDLGFMKRSFRTFVTIDPFSYQLTIGFEKWRFNRYLFTYEWGKEEIASLGSAIKLIFSIAKSKTDFIINLRLESTISEYMPVYVTILRDYMFPIPIANKNAVYKFPFPSWADFKKNVQNVTGKAGDYVWEATKKFLGLDGVFDGGLCVPRSNIDAINKERCPHLKMPSLPSAIQCTFDDLCMGTTCCLELDFKVVKKWLKAWLIVRPSSFSAGIERKSYDRSVDDSFWGERMTLQISKYFNMIFKVTKMATTKMLSIDLNLQMKLYDKLEELFVLEDFQIPQSFYRADWSLGASLDSFRFLRGSVTNVIMRRLDLDLDFFEVKPCPLPSSEPGNNACAFKLPKWSTNTVRVIPKPNCLGIQACVRFKLLSIEYDFKVSMEIDPKDYEIRIAVEKLVWTKYIFENFGQENTFFVKNALGVTYKLETDENGLLVTTVGIRICIDGQCAPPIQLLDKVPVPMPYIDDSGTIVWPSPADPAKMKDWLYNKALETTKDLLGVGDDFFKGKTCDVPTGTSCPYFSLPTLPSFARCKLSKYCTGIECCLDVSMKIAKWSFKAWALLDPCKFVFSFGFEKWMFNDTLFSYKWGEQVEKNIASTIKITYTIGKSADNRNFELTVKFSVKLDKFSISIPHIVLLDKAKIPIPICNQDIKLPSQLIWQDPTKRKEQASAIALTRSGIDAKVLEPSGCKPLNNDNNKRCPHFTLPKTLPLGISLHVMDLCTGIEACMQLDLKIIKRSFKAYILIDPCKLSFSLGFEKWTMNKTLSASLFGQEFVEKIGKALTLKYTIDKTADNRDFIFTLKAVLCLDGTCLPDVVVIDKAMMPIPFCAKDGTFKWPSFDRINAAGEKPASALVMNRMGVEMDSLIGGECIPPASASAVCPYVKLDKLPLGIKCELTEYCTGIKCCASLDLKIVKRNFKFWAILDPCEFSLSIGFENAHYNRSLTGYTFGTKQTMTIGHVNIKYTIDVSNDKKEFLFDLDLQLCLDKACLTKEILKKHTMPIPFCSGLPGSFSISWPSAQNYGSVLYNILGVGLDFFKPKPCIIKKSSKSCTGVFLPTFTQNHCQLKSNCLGIECCFEYDLHVSKVKMSFYFYFDQCKNELHFGLENKAYVVPLDVDVDGKQKVKAIGSMLSVKYLVVNTGYTFKASVELDWCWKNPFTKKKTCGNYEFLKEASFKQFDCPTRKRRSVEDTDSELERFRRGLDIGKLKDQVKGLKDTYERNKDKVEAAKDIWAITKSLIKKGKTGKEIKEYFEQLKKKLPKLGISTKNLKLEVSQREELQAVAGQGVGSFVSGNRIVAGNLQVEGADAIKAMLGKVDSIVGRANEVFTPGAGLTKTGVDLLGAQLAGMTIGEIAAMIDMQNLDPDVVHKLLQDIRKMFEAIYDDLIDAFLSGNMKEFALGDLHLKQRFKIGPNFMQFFKFSTPFLLWIIPCKFNFGIQGYVGVEVEIGAKVLQMWGYGIVTPYTGILVYGELVICAGCLLEAKLRLEGEICDLRFPTMADTYFNKFPFDIAVRMDMVLIPLRWRLKAIVTLKVNLLFVTFTKKLFDKVLYSYQSPSIRKTIFNTHNKKDDNTAAIMEDLSKPSDTRYNMALHNGSPNSGKRSITSPRCVVNQLALRDYTDPAVEISAKATDEESQVKLYLDVGFFPGTSEIYRGKEIAGQSTIINEVFPSASGRKLHFRLCGSNSASAKTCVDCSIPTYDVTLPVLRVTSNFFITSNKHVIEGSYRGFDDSAVAATDGELFAFGLGKGHLDDQISPWKKFSSQAQRKTGRSGDDPATLHATGRDGEDWFTVPVVGRLTAVHVTKRYEQVHSANQCARYCLEFVPLKCMSFNYNYGSNGACELLEGIESIDNELTKDKKYVYFERLAIGSTVAFSRKDLNLKHNDLHYINVFIKNVLGYRNIAASRGILTDFTIPEPGPLGNYSKADDILEFMKCELLIVNHKEKWGKYCVGVDEKEKNHRRVIDGPGAMTMFNGLEPLEDLLYTRANRFVAGNWDGFNDPEGGIRGYTFAVGRQFCEERIKAHHDPHDHLFDESEWTHLGVVMPNDPLEDGTYYLTIRAFNKADYGGPLAMTVCHYVPYTIDNTHPIFNKLSKVEYNETSHWIKANHTARDPDSGLRKMYGCLGQTPKGCEVLDWLLLSSMEYVAFIHKLPDGIAVWVKASAYNNVDMHTVGRADYPIMVDTSPPVAGTVYDGEIIKVDQKFTKYNKKICANWFDFKDTESGITAIELSVGTTPLGVDVVNRTRISPHEHSACIDLEPIQKVLVHRGKYCFTVTAWNGGVNRLYVNGSSNCVLVDQTKPETGDIIDGNLKGFQDVKISSLSSIVAGQFRNFKDPESGIIDEEVQVEVAPAARKEEFQVTHSFESIFDPAGVTGFQWGHFHLKHKDHVRSTIQVTNGAHATSSATTNGYLVDLTNPKLDYIFDGKTPRKDISFQTSDTEMSVNYQFHDDESGIDHYRVLLSEVYQNTRRPIGESPHLPNDQNVYTNSSLSINNGASVYAMVESENTAVPGLYSMFLTSGVKVDKSPPEMIGVYTGVNAGEDEEVYEDSVVQSDKTGILANWIAKDTESGIQEYKVCVGTKDDMCDELSWRSMGTAEDGYISGLALSATGSSGKHYYIRVVAINGAGRASPPMTGTKITILDGDITGHNIDGADGTNSKNRRAFGEDIDFTLDDHTVTMQFEGFESHEYGIQHIEWAIGTTPYGEEVQPFMSEGIVLSDGRGPLVGSGKASAAVDLVPGKKYYTSVRVTTYEGKVLEACSDGITVDHTAPKITITNLGLEGRKKDDLSEGNAIYQYTDAQLSAAWQYTEDTSGIAFAEVAVSTIPGEWDIHPLTNIGKIRADMISSIPDEKFNSTVKPRKGGVANILEVYAGNDVGLISSVTSASILIDDTPPTCGTVTCPKYTKAGTTKLTCFMSGFVDVDSGIRTIEFGIGSAAGRDDIYSFKAIPHTSSFTATNFKLPLKAKRKYHATVKATNMLGLECEGSSDAIIIDDTAPVAGVIVETTDLFYVDFDTPNDADDDKRNKRTCMTAEECQAIDATCQNSMDSIGVAWTHFSDDETGIASYHLAVGTSPGGGQIKPFFAVPVTENSYLITELSLKGKTKLYVTIVAYNGAGLSTSVTSDGIALNYVTQGLEPPEPVYVWDVDSGAEDLDYQTDMEMLRAKWNFRGDPCPSTKYEWRLERMDGEVVQDFVTILGKESASYDGLEMKDGEAYFVKVKGTNSLNDTYIIRSDSITIREDQLVPGRVNDGPFEGFDLMYSPTLTEVEANWHDFGMRKKKVFTVVSGNAGMNEESNSAGKNQLVRYYEASLGTDRRFPHTKSNIVPYTKLNGSHLYTIFKYLNLQLHGVYYVTIRAHSLSSAMAEVTSNGFKAGYGEGVKAGEIEMPDFWGSTSHLLTKWKDFKSEVGMFFYHVGVAKTPLPNDLPCRKLILSKESEDSRLRKYFPVVHMRNVGESTMIELANLSLAHNTHYWVYVVGTDGSGLCNTTSHKFLVDVTRPLEGDIKIGPYWKSLGASYTNSQDKIDVEWRGYSDSESGLDRFAISLWSEASCNSGGSAHLSVDWMKLTANYSSYSIIDLKLVESVPYFVKLRVYNKAGLFAETVSEPILLDKTTPSNGDVINGNDFVHDVVWQKSTTEIHGNFLHYPTASGTPCPDRLINIATSGKQYNDVGIGVKQGVYWGIQYANSAVTKKGTDTIAIEMVKVESGYSYLKSGAVWVDADNEGVFGATIQAADGDGLATTSILFWDGPENELQDYNWEDEPSWTGKNSICQCCFKTPLPKDCPCDCAAYRRAQNTNNVTTTPRPTKAPIVAKSGIVALKTAPTKFTRQRACGFQLIAGKAPYAVLWCSSFNNTLDKQKEKRLLDFNPAAAAYTYKFSLYYNNDDPQKKQWCFAAYETSRNILLGEICGLEEFSSKTKLVFHLWNKDNFIPKSRDWKATAFVSSFRLPPARNLLCRYGKVFRGGTSAIISYEAGIGTSPLKTDVTAYKVISQPCVPCISPCDVYTCDKSCPSNKVTNIKFSLDGLSLPITAKVNGSNETAAVVYYLTVKAVLGSGKSTASSSRGIQIDGTPPVIDPDLNVTYIDVAQGQYKPVNYQSSNSTIRVAFRCLDAESMVVEYKWLIGRKPGHDDVQALTSVGKNPGGTNTRLLGSLRHNHTYYVTVVCINAAGSELRYEDTKGVTMLFEKPIPKDIKNTLPGTKSFAKPVTPKDAKTATDGTYIAVTWTKPRDKNIQRIDVGIGTSVCTDGNAWEDDVFPLTWIAQSEAGKFEIKAGAVYVNGKKFNDLCKYIKPSKTSNYEQKASKKSCVFRMETGRTVFICMRFCDGADQCTMKEGGSVSFLKDGKCTVASSQKGKAISVKVTKNSRKRSVDSFAEIKTPEGLLPGQTLIVGLLDSGQFSANYGSDASMGFKQYIQDPDTTKTMTARALKGRVGTLLGNSFFVNSVGHVTMPGPMVVSVAYAARDMTSTSRPMLLHWDTGTLTWKMSAKTCTSQNGPTETFDTAKLILNTLVCQTHTDTATSTAAKRRKRAPGGSFFDKETQFILAKVDDEPTNNPPVITKEPMITVAEDSSIISHTLTASDPDGDEFVFALDSSKPKPSGAVTIASDGKMTYASCMDCVGIDTVYYTVTEVNMGEIKPLTATASMEFRTTDIPDEPELFLSKNGAAIFSMSSTLNNVHEVNVTVEQFTGYNAAYRDLVFLVGAYDRDIPDVLTISSTKSSISGKLTLGKQDQTKPTLPRTCIDQRADALPCTGITFPHEESKLSWVISSLTYKPNTGFHGRDRFELWAYDNTGVVSNKVTVNFYVLKNPCKNAGTCRGLQDDLNCTAIHRAFVEYHDFYSCSCTGGWSGTVCDVNQDDCISTPCAFPFECYDKLGGYECRCPSDWPDCDKVDHLMPALVSIVFILVISAALIGVAVWLNKKRKERYNRYKKFNDGTEKTDIPGLQPVPFLTGLAKIPGALRHVERVRRKKTTAGKQADSTTKGVEIELTKRRPSIVPPVGTGVLPSKSDTNDVEETILSNEETGSGSRRGSGIKVAWQQNSRKGPAFRNPAFVPETEGTVKHGKDAQRQVNAPLGKQTINVTPAKEQPESAAPTEQPEGATPGYQTDDAPQTYNAPLPHQV